jgi:hypothetical protein
MTIMSSVLSVLLVLALWGMQSLLSYRNITFTAWQWVGYLIWLAWTLLGVALVWTFIDEGEPRAASVGTLIFGGVSAIAAVALAMLWVFS